MRRGAPRSLFVRAFYIPGLEVPTYQRGTSEVHLTTEVTKKDLQGQVPTWPHYQPGLESHHRRSKEMWVFTLESWCPTAPFFPQLRHRDKTRTLLQRVYYVPKKLHHSLLHTSVGECSLACIYYNEVETSHTASQNPQSSWDMQQCNVSSAGGRRGGYDTGSLAHSFPKRGKSFCFFFF